MVHKLTRVMCCARQKPMTCVLEMYRYVCKVSHTNQNVCKWQTTEYCGTHIPACIASKSIAVIRKEIYRKWWKEKD